VLGEAQASAYRIDDDVRHRAVAVREGYRLLAAADYDGALARFTAAKSRQVRGWREPVMLGLPEECKSALGRPDTVAATRDEAALRELAAATRWIVAASWLAYPLLGQS
jgi:hypothetical protein